jgi:hypothetical protein
MAHAQGCGVAATFLRDPCMLCMCVVGEWGGEGRHTSAFEAEVWAFMLGLAPLNAGWRACDKRSTCCMVCRRSLHLLYPCHVGLWTITSDMRDVQAVTLDAARCHCSTCEYGCTLVDPLSMLLDNHTYMLN